MAIAEKEAPSLGSPGLANRVPERSPWPRRIGWIAAAAAAVMVGMVWLTPGFPEGWALSFDDFFDDIQLWIINNQADHWLFQFFLNPLEEAITGAIQGVTDILSRITWLGFLTGASLLAGMAAGWRLALLTAAGVLTFGVLGVWEESLQTLSLVIVSVIVALAIGIPLGIWAGRRPRAERVLRGFMDAMQTIPAYSYLLPCVLLLGIGEPPALIATVIFALPPAVRLTALGIRDVSPTVLEVSESFGSTVRQKLRKVQLPLAKPSIMLGVNQTIMMALGMVVIAAVVGAPGLGRSVLDGLKRFDVGQALNGGIAIVAMAVVLDRVTATWSQRDRRAGGDAAMTVAGRRSSRRTMTLTAVGLTIVAVVVGREVLHQQVYPDAWATSVAGVANAIVGWSSRNLVGLADAIAAVLRFLLDPIESVLLEPPWWIVGGVAAGLGWAVSGARLAVGTFLCFLGIGVLGTWEVSMQTLAQVLVAVLVAVVIAIPMGVAAARSDRLDRALRPILDTMQTMPSFVYLVPVLLLFSAGRVPALIAAVVYALPVGIRLTSHGIRGVPSAIVEAGQAFGSTRRQLLWKVQFPLARPSILLGVNQTIMMVLSVMIIAGLIGGEGLGFDILVALSRREIGRGLAGGLSLLLLALFLDRVTQAMGAAGKTTRGPVGLMGQVRWPRLRAIRTGSGSNGKGEV
ncbi:MAG: ABC transporter permease subunit [Actinomycetota bacterium]